MSLRIPGRQPPLGIDGYFLNESPGWIPPRADDGRGTASDATGAIVGLAGGPLGNAAGPVYDTAEVEQGISDGETTGDERSSLIARAVSEANGLRGDDISQNFGPIDNAIGGAGNVPGNTPGGDLGGAVPPPPDTSFPGDNRGV